RPYAIGFITPFIAIFEGHFRAALDARPDAIALSFSDPGEWARRVKDAGIKLICQLQTFQDADLAVAAGADVLVAQGTEAGGDTVFTRVYDIAAGLPWPPAIGERVRRDSFTDEWAEREADLRQHPDHATPGVPILYGQSARFVGAVRAAAEVVRDVSEQAEAVLRT